MWITILVIINIIILYEYFSINQVFSDNLGMFYDLNINLIKYPWLLVKMYRNGNAIISFLLPLPLIIKMNLIRIKLIFHIAGFCRVTDGKNRKWFNPHRQAYKITDHIKLLRFGRIGTLPYASKDCAAQYIFSGGTIMFPKAEELQP